MFLQILKGKIHRATVTRADLNYEGSISVDELLMQSAGLIPFEAVHVWNVTNGERLETYVLSAPKGSGEICLNGAAARKVAVGDLVIITAFTWIESKEIERYAPKIVLVTAENRLRSETVNGFGLDGVHTLQSI
jgi:aspartate 1-decarboxylase